MIGCRTLQLKARQIINLSVSFTVDQFVLKEHEHTQQCCHLSKYYYEEDQVSQKISLSVSFNALSHVFEGRNENRDPKVISQIGSISRGIRATILKTTADVNFWIEPKGMAQCEGSKDQECPRCCPVHGKLIQQLKLLKHHCDVLVTGPTLRAYTTSRISV